MIVDPAVLAVTFPHNRKLHFWAKNSLFANKYTRPILVGGGVVPVDRATKNNKALFAATLEAALEYASQITQQDNTEESNSDDDIVIIKKRNERQIIIIPYGSPIQIDPYLKDFSLDNRVTVKALTKRIESEIEKLTINASNWEISNAASMTRMLYFSDDKRVPLEDYVKVTQRLLSALSGGRGSKSSDMIENLVATRRLCLDNLRKVSEDYRSKSDDLRLALEISEREQLSDGLDKKSA
ncbi:11292_t:CDS:2 [Racocetra fulgida]|uniref:11292_t:CDS:1 n=1 Tax=Racocetra fulgida TaxID=60492 RepID=A0A9N9HDW5_9GLOM|nr:11292_t:CDS:2 [Racocetra fulgida]